MPVRRSEARERFWPIFWRTFWRISRHADGSAIPSHQAVGAHPSALLHIEVPTWKRTDVGWSSMAGNRRMPRERATAALSTLLEAICAGGAHADCVTAVYVFGSYARAPSPSATSTWTSNTTRGWTRQ
jgi:hypothetical protein